MLVLALAGQRGNRVGVVDQRQAMRHVRVGRAIHQKGQGLLAQFGQQRLQQLGVVVQVVRVGIGLDDRQLRQGRLPRGRAVRIGRQSGQQPMGRLRPFVAGVCRHHRKRHLGFIGKQQGQPRALVHRQAGHQAQRLVHRGLPVGIAGGQQPAAHDGQLIAHGLVRPPRAVRTFGRAKPPVQAPAATAGVVGVDLRGLAQHADQAGQAMRLQQVGKGQLRLVRTTFDAHVEQRAQHHQVALPLGLRGVLGVHARAQALNGRLQRRVRRMGVDALEARRAQQVPAHVQRLRTGRAVVALAAHGPGLDALGEQVQPLAKARCVALRGLAFRQRRPHGLAQGQQGCVNLVGARRAAGQRRRGLLSLVVAKVIAVAVGLGDVRLAHALVDGLQAGLVAVQQLGQLLGRDGVARSIKRLAALQAQKAQPCDVTALRQAGLRALLGQPGVDSLARCVQCAGRGGRLGTGHVSRRSFAAR